jgi:glutamate formiminotransferase/formiminotetrahydrofolate cyclodeaminase
MNKPIIECVPNFSEGRNPEILDQIAAIIRSVDGVRLLDVDPGKATNRTVMTFVGEPEPVIEAAFLAIQKASELIDMRHHHGEHPRMGATDVCPLIPIANISMEEVAVYARKLGKRVGEELGISVFLYENAASAPERRNLATIRSGEYEGMATKLKEDRWKPDFGPAQLNERSGVTAIGARDFLIAYNVNLNTTSVRRANSVAFDVREQGRVIREGNPVTGKILTDEQGEPQRQPGMCKAVKGIGWFIEEYGIAQVSMNLTNIRETPLHIAFEACCKSATARGLRVTGSELVGLVPKQVMLDAGKYFLHQQERSTGIGEDEIIRIAIRTMGLDELSPFDPRKKIIEYQMEDATQSRLISMSLKQFAAETASETPAPGGGSISAYVGALGAALAGMVANLSAHKRGWDDQWKTFSDYAEQAREIQDKLMFLVDEDTRSFNAIMDAFALPKGTEDEKAARSSAIQKATKGAIMAPFRVMQEIHKLLPILEVMVDKGNPNSASDGGVGMLCARAAMHGAWMNVRINASGLKDKEWLSVILLEGEKMVLDADAREKAIMDSLVGKL